MRRELGDGYELDDDRGRIDREAVHRFLSGEAYWALGRTREVVDILPAPAQETEILDPFERAADEGVEPPHRMIGPPACLNGPGIRLSWRQRQ